MKNYSKAIVLPFAAALTLIVGAHGLRAQGQSGMFADADGIAAPDTGIAYEIPVNAVAMMQQYPLWPELADLLADPDGMNAPNMGFAYELPGAAKSFAAQSISDPATQALLLDADGLEPPDIGMAYEFIPVLNEVAEGSTRASK